jgi:hypothetical protein
VEPGDGESESEPKKKAPIGALSPPHLDSRVWIARLATAALSCEQRALRAEVARQMANFLLAGVRAHRHTATEDRAIALKG